MQWTNFDEFVDRRILYSNAIQCGWKKKFIAPKANETYEFKMAYICLIFIRNWNDKLWCELHAQSASHSQHFPCMEKLSRKVFPSSPIFHQYTQPHISSAKYVEREQYQWRIPIHSNAYPQTQKQRHDIALYLFDRLFSIFSSMSVCMCSSNCLHFRLHFPLF